MLEDVLPQGTSFVSLKSADPAFSTLPRETTKGVIGAEIAELAPGVRVKAIILVDLDDNLPGGEDILNTISVEGVLSPGDPKSPKVFSNITRDKTPLSYALKVTDTGTGADPALNNGGDDDGVSDDTQTVDNLPQGAGARFHYKLTNEGTAEDTFNLNITPPKGWTVQYRSPDGMTPLPDSNGDTLPDTGPLKPGETVELTVLLVPPADVSGKDIRMMVPLKGRSIHDSAVEDSVDLSVKAITAAKLDIANSQTASGFGDKGVNNADSVGTDPTLTQTAAPGGTTRFPLFLVNEGDDVDAYSLSAWGSSAATTPLPSSWRVRFINEQGHSLSSTPNLRPGDIFTFFAEVTPPLSAVDGTEQSVFFRALSSITGAVDVVYDSVRVVGKPGLYFASGQRGETSACTSVDYIHTLRNTGQKAEIFSVAVKSQTSLSSALLLPKSVVGDGPSEFMPLSNLGPDQPFAVFKDGAWTMSKLVSNGAGGVGIPLGSGEETRVMARVFASCGLQDGQKDRLVLETQSLDGKLISSLTDYTVVTSSRLSITKTGAEDTQCDGKADTTFSQEGKKAGPGQCVLWGLDVTNKGEETVCNVTITDQAPGYTSLFGQPVLEVKPSGAEGDCKVTEQSISCTVGHALDIDGDSKAEQYCLRPNEKARVVFSVKID